MTEEKTIPQLQAELFKEQIDALKVTSEYTKKGMEDKKIIQHMAIAAMNGMLVGVNNWEHLAEESVDAAELLFKELKDRGHI